MKTHPDKEPARPAERPREVFLAVGSLFISYLIGLPGTIVALLHSEDPADLMFKIMDALVILGVLSWITMMIYYGFNWARFLYLVLFALGAIFILTSLIPLFIASKALFSVLVLQALLQSFALWLVFTPPGRWWYLKRPAIPDPKSA